MYKIVIHDILRNYTKYG